jgi:exodeoxyribonuclease X
MKLIVLDTETSGLDPSKGDTILELAWIVLSNEDNWKPKSFSRMYIQYSGPINPHAQASHHIRSDSLTAEHGAYPRDAAVQFMLKEIGDDSICVAHNVDFDSKFLPEIKRPWICTFRSAKHVWPNAPGYGNQVLRYWLNINVTSQEILDVAPIIAHQHPHQALFDVATTTGILLKMLERYTPEQLLHLSRSPVTLKSLNFGKHKGLEINRVPRDYLQWLRRQNNLDEDVKHTIDSVLQSS